MKTKILTFCKVLYKILPYIVAILGGGTLAATVTGCKLGSIISLSTPL